jgi:general secretion pathway protein C
VQPTFSVADIVAHNLFGEAKAGGTAPAAYDAPATHLRLNLEGVFQADSPQDSAAIVAEQGRPGELFLVGGKLPGNAVLTEVHADRIVLRRGSVYETLRFDDVPASMAAGSRDEAVPLEMIEPANDAPIAESFTPEAPTEAPPQASVNEVTPTPALTNVVQSYRERLQHDPTGTLQSLGVAPVAPTGAQGYRLDNLASSPFLAQTGLQAGDVVLSVNGRPVGDVQQDQQEIDNIVAQGSARLEVQRGARRFFVTASLK